jgi:hypothetical protein
MQDKSEEIERCMLVWLWWCAGSYSRTNQDWIVIFTFQNWWWNIEIQIGNNKLWIKKLPFCEVSIPQQVFFLFCNKTSIL